MNRIWGRGGGSELLDGPEGDGGCEQCIAASDDGKIRHYETLRSVDDSVAAVEIYVRHLDRR